MLNNIVCNMPYVVLSLHVYDNQMLFYTVLSFHVCNSKI